MRDLAAAAAEAQLVFAIPQAERSLLARIGETLALAAGRCLIREGTEGEDFFLVLAGELEVEVGRRRVALITTGGVIGEMALFNAKRRTSRVTTLTECKLVRVSASVFLKHVHRGDEAGLAFMERLGGVMVKRLQAAERASSLGRPGLDEGGARLRERMLKEWALRYHALGKPGKIEIQPTRAVGSIADIAVAYAPGAIEPSVAIYNQPAATWEYTARGRLVGLVTNGSSILGKGALGPDAAKPLLEGKSVLLKRFAGVDAFDLELAELEPTRFVELVCALEPTFGAVALEHLASPTCLAIVDACSRRMEISVVHDDQHCVAVVAVAAALNGLHLAGKDLQSARIVVSGNGPAAVGTGKLLRTKGVGHDKLIVVDEEGPLHPGRSLRTWFMDLAATPCPPDRAAAIAGADVYVGCGTAAPLSPDELRSMGTQPVVISLGVPAPEITWPQAMRVRKDVLFACSEGTHGNHATTLLVFPHLLRALLDCRARRLPMAALAAAADSIAALARAGGVDARGVAKSFGPAYLLPSVIDPRLPNRVPVAVADAIMADGDAGLHVDLKAYHARRQRFKLTLT